MTITSRRISVVIACLLAASAVLATASAHAQSASHTARARAAYTRAVQLQSKLESQTPDERLTTDYKKAINEFRAVYYLDPAYTKAPVAAETVGDLYAEMGHVFSDSTAFEAAIEAYQFLIAQYPGSSMARNASFAIAEVYSSGLNDNPSAAKAFQSYLSSYPDSAQAPQARKRLKQIKELIAEAAKSDSDPDSNTDGDTPRSSSSKPVEESITPSGSNALVEVTDIHQWVGPNYTRVVIAAKGPVSFNTIRLSNPDRIVFDLPNTYVSHSLNGKEFPVTGGFLREVRVAQFKPTVSRIVLDLEKIDDYSVFPLPNPFRLIIDVHGPVPELAEKAPKPIESSSSALPKQKVSVVNHRVTEVSAAEKTAEPANESSMVQPRTDAPNRQAVAANDGDAVTTARPRTTDSLARPRSTDATRADVIAAAPRPASPTEGGSQTLTRALGLKVARIVIDPGHGGHDTGTIGKNGLLEKDVALDVALRLRKLIERRTDSQVIMTRSDDTFIPLEERTAIANEKNADLFISIHLNSSPSPGVRGIETYYLNFTSDQDALALAARENATSQESVHQLQDLIKKIALSDKIEESQEFARDVQRALYRNESRIAGGRISNRGVRKAPFVVLIGANMPSILAEISFLSNSRDELLLKRPSYREKIAEALFRGIEDYTSDLGSVRVAQSTN